MLQYNGLFQIPLTFVVFILFFAAMKQKKETREGTHIMEPEGTNDQSEGGNLEAVVME